MMLLNTTWLGERWKAFLPHASFTERVVVLDASSASVVMARKWLSAKSQGTPCSIRVVRSRARP
jgi:hypothetical protein